MTIEEAIQSIPAGWRLRLRRQKKKADGDESE
jgi:hypothetical protein